MLRKALIGAAAAGAASLLAVGAASPAMAQNNNVDQGDINILSNFCVNLTDVVAPLQILTYDNASCEWSETSVIVNKDGDHHKHGYDKRGYDD
jgi:hypothetical protein